MKSRLSLDDKLCLIKYDIIIMIRPNSMQSFKLDDGMAILGEILFTKDENTILTKMFLL